MDFAAAQSILATAGVEIASGLTPQEFERIEQRLGFRFPPDLRLFLSIGLPISKSWVNWREMDDENIRQRLDSPFEGIAFDIEANAFWLPEWGVKPSDSVEAIRIARAAVLLAPKLIPICGHRYIPESPHEAGNPVFSVHQTDIIYYGVDLLDYLQNEFSYYFKRIVHTIEGVPKHIDFWSEFT